MTGRIRTIKPEILEDDKTASLDHEAWRLFVSSFLLADDHGNFRATPKLVEGLVFHSRDTRESVATLLEQLRDCGLISLYEVRGQVYASIVTWPKHQKVDHPSKPRIPLPSDTEATLFAMFSRKPRETLAPDPDPDPDPDLGPRPVPTTMDQDRAGGAAIKPESPSAPSGGSPRKRKADTISPERKAKAKAIHDAFVAGYWQKIGKAPPWGGREWGQLYNLLGSWTPEDLLELVPAFFAWANKDVIRTGYQFGTGPHCFVLKAGELQADILAPKRRAVAAAVEDRERSANRAAATQDQASRVAQKIIEAQNGKQHASESFIPGRDGRPIAAGGPARRDVQPALIGRSHGDVGRVAGATLWNRTEEGDEESLPAAIHAEPR